MTVLKDLSKGKYQRTMINQSSPQAEGESERQGTNHWSNMNIIQT